MDREKISKRLVELRGDKSPSEVAYNIKVTENAYRNYERGWRVPSDYVKARLAKYYNTTIDDIFFAD